MKLENKIESLVSQFRKMGKCMYLYIYLNYLFSFWTESLLYELGYPCGSTGKESACSPSLSLMNNLYLITTTLHFYCKDFSVIMSFKNKAEIKVINYI